MNSRQYSIGTEQYRLFFRYHASSKVIVLAWVNDEDTKGNPPDDWNQLLTEAQSTADHLQAAVTR